ncbi:hypothetical protein LPTSP4_03630 [Leptospira ryugenii]|uniref:Uncharacterized protein n=1 Tax=Leptospira ryugenii TaxID=1917863 RepID=A0A2P2DW57_9LEPT|nr:glycosyltransferase family 39 protein [Leptospira ryugenii]GBF48863.1 hypothetical protein LPTSP4_03630 [Leptospira ryugenii]
MNVIRKKIDGLSLFAIGLIFIGAFIRYYQYDRLGYWYDELYSITLSSLGFWDMVSELQTETNPPLYQITLWIWIQLFGNAPESGRILSLLLSISFLPIVYLQSKTLLDRYQRVLLLIMCVFSSGFIFYAHETRSYALLVLLSGLSFLSFSKLMRNVQERGNIYLFLLFSILTENTHYFGFLFVHLLWFVYLSQYFLVSYKNSDWKAFAHQTFLYFILGIFFSWEFYKLVYIIPKVDNIDWIPEPDLEIYLHYFSYLFYFFSFKKIPILGILIVLIVLPFVFIVLGKLSIDWRREFQSLVLTLLLTILFLFATYLISLQKPIVTSRNLLVLSLPIYFALSLWFSHSLSVFPKKGFLILIFLLFLLSYLSFSKNFYKGFQKEPWREVVQKAIELSHQSTLYLSFGDHRYWNYYLHDIYQKGEVLELSKSQDACQDLQKDIQKKGIKQVFVFESLWDVSKKYKERTDTQRVCFQQLAKQAKNKEQISFIVMTLWSIEY